MFMDMGEKVTYMWRLDNLIVGEADGDDLIDWIGLDKMSAGLPKKISSGSRISNMAETVGGGLRGIASDGGKRGVGKNGSLTLLHIKTLYN